MQNQKGFTLVEMILSIIVVVMMGSWVVNIIKISDMSFDVITTTHVLRVAGILLVPLGAVMGFI